MTWGTLHGWAPEGFNLFSFTLSHWCIDNMIMYDQNCSALREALICWDTFLVRKICFELLINPEVDVNHQRELYSKAVVPHILPPGICASLGSVWGTEMLKWQWLTNRPFAKAAGAPMMMMRSDLSPTAEGEEDRFWRFERTGPGVKECEHPSPEITTTN